MQTTEVNLLEVTSKPELISDQGFSVTAESQTQVRKSTTSGCGNIPIVESDRISKSKLPKKIKSILRLSPMIKVSPLLPLLIAIVATFNHYKEEPIKGSFLQSEKQGINIYNSDNITIVNNYFIK